MTEAPLKTVVFIDAQNVYRTAREAFGWENESSKRGNFRPLMLGQLLTTDPRLVLMHVMVYTGLPSKERDDQGHRAARKRFDTWVHEGGGKVFSRERNLQYRRGEAPREKGVDVLLAIDLVRLAIAKKFQHAIVVSADNDLVPALEVVCDIRGSQSLQSVSLRAEPGCESAPALGVTVTPRRPQISRRLLDRSEYESIEDLRSYNPNSPTTLASAGRPLPGQSGRELPRHKRSSER